MGRKMVPPVPPSLKQKHLLLRSLLLAGFSGNVFWGCLCLPTRQATRARGDCSLQGTADPGNSSPARKTEAHAACFIKLGKCNSGLKRWDIARWWKVLVKEKEGEREGGKEKEKTDWIHESWVFCFSFSYQLGHKWSFLVWRRPLRQMVFFYPALSDIQPHFSVFRHRLNKGT